MIMEHRGSMQRLGCLKKTGGHMLCEPGGPRASGALSVRQRGTAQAVSSETLTLLQQGNGMKKIEDFIQKIQAWGVVQWAHGKKMSLLFMMASTWLVPPLGLSANICTIKIQGPGRYLRDKTRSPDCKSRGQGPCLMHLYGARTYQRTSCTMYQVPRCLLKCSVVDHVHPNQNPQPAPGNQPLVGNGLHSFKQLTHRY